MADPEKPIAIIPARGGSKRLPRKNVLPLAGKPLIAHTIETALASEVFARVVVSTEDEEIAEVARRYGGDVPFMRPAELATDSATAVEVVLNALDELTAMGEDYATFALLQPTSPLRTVEDIRGAHRMLVDEDAWFVIGITRWEHPPLWALEREGLAVRPYFGVEQMRNAQELPQLWKPSGSLFLGHRDKLRETGSFHTEKTLGYEVPTERAIDIDSAHDLFLAECLMGRDDR